LHFGHHSLKIPSGVDRHRRRNPNRFRRSADRLELCPVAPAPLLHPVRPGQGFGRAAPGAAQLRHLLPGGRVELVAKPAQ